jgi:nicotinate phosphoribosyltransferase
VGKKLHEKGKQMVGVRIDSGDLAYYSNMAREMLDNAGFTDAKVVASNDLDEYLVFSLKVQEASINVWGIGTKLVTAYDQPALGAVYKLAAIKNKEGEWEPKLKVSQQTIKINIPGIQNVKRFYRKGTANADMIFLEDQQLDEEGPLIIDPIDPTKRKKIEKGLESELLLKPIFKSGKQVYELQDIHDIKRKTMSNLQKFDKAHKRLVNPHIYPVGLEESLFNLKTDLVLKAKNQ